jgi:hypothetical protein
MVKLSADFRRDDEQQPHRRHDEFIPRVGLVVGLRLPASMRVVDLQSRFRCRECDRRGSVAISIKWAEG